LVIDVITPARLAVLFRICSEVAPVV